jgi:hypothetical protein
MPDGCNHSPEKDSCGELSRFKEINFSYGYELSYPTVRIYQSKDVDVFVLEGPDDRSQAIYCLESVQKGIRPVGTV